MDKKLVVALAGLVIIAGVVFFVIGPGSGSSAKQDAKATSAEAAGEAPGKAKAAPVVGKEELREANAPDAADLTLPGALPALKGVQPAAGQAVAPPAQPHGQLELEGDVQQDEAEQAIKAMWPAIRDCYVELRQRAPQARGRMLMTFKVKPGDAGQAATGELFLKETQFTDPKYLTCVRTAIDSARFPVGRNVTGSVTVPLLLSPQDAGEAPPAQ